MAKEQCGWLISLTDRHDSDWGSVDEFYESVLSSSRRRATFTIDSNFEGKLSRKEPIPRRGDGLGFYHSQRAKMPQGNPFGRRPRISLIGTLEGMSHEGVKVSGFSASLRLEDISRMRAEPIIRDESTEGLFQDSGVVRGVPASFYYVPPRTWTQFKKLAAKKRGQVAQPSKPAYDEEIEALEGQNLVRFVRHRFREASLRSSKIASAIAASRDGRLRCEVPGCGFDFEAVYGKLGLHFAEVHHLQPLSVRAGSTLTTLKALAVVCANCHRMIHRGGENRSLKGLIQPRSKL